jgi:hypothetical protein
MHAAQFRWLRRRLVRLLHHGPPVAETVKEVPAA